MTSVVPYLALMALQIWMLEAGISFWVVLPIAIPTAGFLLRTFIVFHDCTHGSFMPTKRGNHVLGAFVGLLVFTPFQTWRHSHAMHHATAGDLDRRGSGRRADDDARGVPRPRLADARSATASSATRSSCSASAGCGASSSSRAWSPRTPARA